MLPVHATNTGIDVLTKFILDRKPLSTFTFKKITRVILLKRECHCEVILWKKIKGVIMYNLIKS